jgi:hypothetical protein
MQIGFNEGKVCDAVLRRIERREGAVRKNCRWPEREHREAPVEMVCDIGCQLIALEHTGVEPFEGYMRLQNDALTHFRPLEVLISKSLPQSDYVLLDMPLKATEGLRGKELAKVQTALAAYVLTTAPTLPVSNEGRFAEPIHRAQPPGVPFEITLHRWSRSWHAKSFEISQTISGDRTAMRLERIARACCKKYPKLAAWRATGARTILVLEDNDVQLSNESLVADAILSAERTLDCVRPDEIYLVTTFHDPWYGHVLRIDGKNFFDFSYEEQSKRYWEIAPATLIDVMQKPLLRATS